ncbi:MAG: GntR family transcriptional regulator [Ignavibacteriaceae bacterium]
MLIKIDFETETPIYLQIKNQIIEGIASRTLTEGESLPSVRQFAVDIGINMHTVNKAYALLRKEGFVTIHRRKGVIVNKLSQMHNPGFMKEVSRTIKPVIAEAYCKGITEEEFILPKQFQFVLRSG